ncbi:Clavaminate synthase-like protein [Gymnopus androsaceus JB14]|uniref:Clavaminate synthase-like protein n=1 Tax=Gymnopus androsaceus JB14 TaxID=1447944 RepID=A0A6A4H6X5_9AGAR|nr:Clavaminate synthase-like protein [Gymnopus androsaceus JB14]
MTPPQIPPYVPHPPTQYKLDYAPLIVIDLSTFDRSHEDQVRLAQQLKDAAHNTGFWMVTGHGITDAEMNRQLSIGQAFYKEPIESKRQYPCDFSNGSYLGYREPVRFIADTDVKENHEALNIAKFTNEGCRFPLHDFIVPFADEIKDFQLKIWKFILKKLLILCAILLELPEQHFVKLHDYAKKSDDYLCYKIYHPRTDEQTTCSLSTYVDTDFGSMTLVFSGTQTVSGLQIRTPTGEWKHVKSIPGGITVNAADTLAMITDGYFKSTVHAVHRPPPDQDKFDRLALLYFLRLADDADVVPAPSPLLERIGWKKETREAMTATNEGDAPIKGEEWMKARVRAYNHRETIESTNEPEHFTYRGLQVQVQY